MALLDCRGCGHGTNTVFVDYAAARIPRELAVTTCVGRYTGRVRNEVERGCAYESADAWLRERVDGAIARFARRATQR